MDPYAPYPLNLVRDWLHRRRWWVRLALAAVLVPWFGHFAYTRWTAEPVLPFDPTALNLTVWDASLSLPDAAVDRTRQMVAAMKSLPPLPTVPVPTTAPAGFVWTPSGDAAASLSAPVFNIRRGPTAAGGGTRPTPTFTLEIDVACLGEWKPEERYHLQQIIVYVEQPATSTALDSIRALVGKPYCINHSSAGMGGPPGGTLSSVRQVSWLFVARARYHLAQKNDFQAALRDIDTTLQLAADTERDHMYIAVLTGLAVRGLAFFEVALWGQEFDLSTEQRRQMAEMIQRHRIDAPALAEACFEGEFQLFFSNLDMLYTKDARGNGWPVMHTRKPGLDWLACENLLSPFFDNRRETLNQLDQYRKNTISVMGERAKGARKADAHPAFRMAQRSPTSPGLALAPDFLDLDLPRYIHHANARGASVITAHALEAWHRKYGAYPANLSSLVPEMLAALPPDPCSETQAPLRYRLDETQGYVLYSVGSNGQDDDGLTTAGRIRDQDWVFSIQRSGLQNLTEWVLAPAGSQRISAPQSLPAPMRQRGRR